MREFHIPAPPADLRAVKDWRGTVWTREDQSDDMFLHQWPDAETPERRSWWQLIEDGPLTEYGPERAPETETVNICPCCANYIVNGDDCEHYPCFASEPLKYIDVTRNIEVDYSKWVDRNDLECDSCGVESDYYGGLYRAVSRHYLDN